MAIEAPLALSEIIEDLRIDQERYTDTPQGRQVDTEYREKEDSLVKLAKRLTEEHGVLTKVRFRTNYSLPFERSLLQTPEVKLQDGNHQVGLVLTGTVKEERSWPDPTAGYPIDPVYGLHVVSPQLKDSITLFNFKDFGTFGDVQKIPSKYPPTMRELDLAGELLVIMERELPSLRASQVA